MKENHTKICVTIPTKLYIKLKKYAFDRNITRSDVITILLAYSFNTKSVLSTLGLVEVKNAIQTKKTINIGEKREN